MRAEVKGIVFPDVERDPSFPENASNFMTLAMILASPRGESGEESFQVEVVTPAWIQEVVETSGPAVGRHYLVVKSWDEPGIRKFLTDWVESQEAPTWNLLGERLGRIGLWEFEDYRPAASKRLLFRRRKR